MHSKHDCKGFDELFPDIDRKCQTTEGARVTNIWWKIEDKTCPICAMQSISIIDEYLVADMPVKKENQESAISSIKSFEYLSDIRELEYKKPINLNEEPKVVTKTYSKPKHILSCGLLGVHDEKRWHNLPNINFACKILDGTNSEEVVSQITNIRRVFKGFE